MPSALVLTAGAGVAVHRSSCERCENLLWRPHAIPLPTPRAGTEHVGSRYDERDRPYREDHRLLAQAFEPGCTPCWGALVRIASMNAILLPAISRAPLLLTRLALLRCLQSRTPEMEAEVAAQLVELAQTPGGLLTAGQQRLKELQRKRIGEARHQALRFVLLSYLGVCECEQETMCCCALRRDPDLARGSHLE